jgi:hypothetical protein
LNFTLTYRWYLVPSFLNSLPLGLKHRFDLNLNL